MRVSLLGDLLGSFLGGSLLLLFLLLPHTSLCSRDGCEYSGSGVSCWGLDEVSPFAEDTKHIRIFNSSLKSVAEMKPLEHLRSFSLVNTRIRQIPEYFLDRFPSLLFLDIVGGEIEVLEALSSRGHNIKVLRIINNRIWHVSSDALGGLTRLRLLALSGNALRSLPTSLLSATQRVSLSLARNPLRCDCRLRPLLSKLSRGSSKRVKYHGEKQHATRKRDEPEDGECLTPEALSGRSVHDLKEEELECVSPELENGGNQLTLGCPFGSNTLWMYNNTEIEESYSDAMELLPNGSLVIPNKEDISLFSCSLEKKLRASRQVQVSTEGSPPQFIFKSPDRVYREGSAVEAHCEVTGDPRPLIEWSHRGRPLITTRKYELSNHNQVLRVYPFLESDTGSYACRVSNRHGHIEGRFRMDLVKSVPPTIIEAPQSVTVNEGSSVSFRCNAKGVPRPAITWFFDGSEIANIRGRHMVSDDGTELTIKIVLRQDDGVYGCMAGNAVGAMNADGTLTVLKNARIKEMLTDAELKNIAEEARRNVDRAIETTRKQDGVTDIDELKSIVRVSFSPKTIELTKAREIYEGAIRLVHEHVKQGLNLTGKEVASNVSYESVLSESHMRLLMEFAGCLPGQFKDNPCTDRCFHSKFRSYDGQCNNPSHPMRGVSQWPLRRLLPPIYENGFNTPVGWEPDRLYNGFKKPNARKVSRDLVTTREITAHSQLSSFVMQWGQLVDHDLTHTAMPVSRNTFETGAVCNRTCDNSDPCFNIPLLPGDPKLKRNNWHHQKYPCIEFERSGAVCGSGETSVIFERVSYREQMNIITSYLDASFVYGSTESQALELRDLFGDKGLLRFDMLSASKKPLLPFEKDSDMDCRRNYTKENPVRCFLAGDLRANEQLALTAIHTLFMREHNRLAEILRRNNPTWNSHRIYQEARKIVGAFVQHITYEHWLPNVLGKKGNEDLIGPYSGYDPEVDATVSNVFATAAFRFGHTLINPILRRLDNNFQTIQQGDILLHEAFFAPERLLREGGIDPLLRGLFASPLKLPRPSQLLNSELTDLLFDRAHEVALDLASINIQRGRDHGLPGYTAYRRFCGLSAPENWDEMKRIVPDDMVIQKLKMLYGHPGNIDVWVGGITEPALPGGLVGPLFGCLIAEQFKRLRSGDRFWYENKGIFKKEQLEQIKKITLSRLLCDNGDNINRVQKDVFMFPGSSPSSYSECDLHPQLDLTPWNACCDVDCSVDREQRTRRSTLGCFIDGGWFRDNSTWHTDKCSKCTCKASTVLCTTEANCR